MNARSVCRARLVLSSKPLLSVLLQRASLTHRLGKKFSVLGSPCLKDGCLEIFRAFPMPLRDLDMNLLAFPVTSEDWRCLVRSLWQSQDSLLRDVQMRVPRVLWPLALVGEQGWL